MGRYPEVRSALPTHFVKQTRTAKMLPPAITFMTVMTLAAASIVGIVVAGYIFGVKTAAIGGVKAAQGFQLLAVSKLAWLGTSLIWCGSH